MELQADWMRVVWEFELRVRRKKMRSRKNIGKKISGFATLRRCGFMGLDLEKGMALLLVERESGALFNGDCFVVDHG